MNPELVDLVLRHVSETKHLLDSLIVSSESFDYPKAKLALKALQRKQRDLGKLRASLEAHSALPPNVVQLTFSAAAPRPAR